MKKSKRSRILAQSLVQKVSCQQTFGKLSKSSKFHGTAKPFFEKCPEHSQIHLHQILGDEVFCSGHVALGFTRDGKYLLSYQCKVDGDNLSGELYVQHHYSLQWWEFNFKSRARKVHEIPLFANEEIHQELHLLVSQVNDGNLIVVHGSPFMQSDMEASNRECYITVARNFGSRSESINNIPIVNIKYESLPPYPLFNPSVNLKQGGVILINSGDAVQSFDISDILQIQDEIERNASSRIWPSQEQKGITCSLSAKPKPMSPEADCRQSFQDKSSDNVDGLSQNETIALDEIKWFDSLQEQGVFCSNEGQIQDVTDLFQQSNQFSNCYQYDYVKPGDLIRNESEVDGSSSGIISLSVTTLIGQAYQNGKCKRIQFPLHSGSTKGSIFQTTFDAERFISTILHKWEEFYDSYLVLRDYDMQIVEVCDASNEVLLMLKYLVAVNRRTPSKSHVKGYQQYHTTGFLLSWNIKSGEITLLKRDPFLEYNPSRVKSKRFCPGFHATAELRKKWFIPKGYRQSIFTFSNHTTITGKSLKYILHPFQPLAVIL